MDIESCPICGDTGKVAIFDGECIEYEQCPDPECIPVSVQKILNDLGDDPLSDVPF